MNDLSSRPIGIFDSGLGGLTVLKAVHALLPNENIVYFGDSGRAPYGTKSKETVLKYTVQDMNFLLSQGVKMIVIACNTASACSLETVSELFELPIVDVVGAGADEAVKVTKSGNIGVIGTGATVASGVYERAIKSRMPEAEYHAKACALFVPLVEEGWWNHQVTGAVAKEYLQSLKDFDIDTLVLGCTHYPYLENVIGNVMGEKVSLINSASAVAKKVKECLSDNNILNGDKARGKVSYFTSDSVEKFKSLGGLFLGEPMEKAEKVEIDRMCENFAISEEM
jgi:glutamate racemase